MKRSVNEICGMVLKAARGAGIPLGHAQDVAMAAGYLAITDPQRLIVLKDALSGAEWGCTYDWGQDRLVCTQSRAVMVGPLAVDALRSGIDTVVLRDLDAPRLVLAYCAATGLGATAAQSGNDLTLWRDANATPAPATPCSVTVSSELWDFLAGLAHHTYVPASEASRLAGAGAGLTDND